MPLVLYNTLSRKKEVFAPIDPNRVRMYVCGPTVYDFAHIGNGRPVVVFDLLFRLLRHHYGDGNVVYVRNITDVDDKIINGARENNEPIDVLTRRTTEAFHADMADLGAMQPTHEPKATEHISQMIAMIERLMESGHAYAAEGHVLFNVPSDPDYGKLSGRNRDEQIDGARVEVAPYKRDPADFVLWKPSSVDQPGWASPWGRGRPGWHIECSAMSEAHLGETFDIHGGGLDLVFPHHENEIAQSECTHGKPFVRFWVHNGWVMVNGEKMSKSLGNYFTVRQLLEEGIPGEVLRLVLLSTHYRQPLDFTRQGVNQGRARLDRWYRVLELAEDEARTNYRVKRSLYDTEIQVPDQVIEALTDDLSTPEVFHRVNLMVDNAFEFHRRKEHQNFGHEVAEIRRTGDLLGLLQMSPNEWFRGQPAGRETIDAGQIEQLIAARNAARKAKDFTEADRIRNDLLTRGILLEDTPHGTTWRRAG